MAPAKQEVRDLSDDATCGAAPGLGLLYAAVLLPVLL